MCGCKLYTFTQDFSKNDEDYHKYVSQRIYTMFNMKMFVIYKCYLFTFDICDVFYLL